MINKPINPSPHNVCVNREQGLTLQYDIPQNTVDGRCFTIFDLETGENVFVDNNILDSSTSHISLDVDLSGLENLKNEYGWNSYYWKTPSQGSKKDYVVADINEDVGSILLRPEENINTTIEPSYGSPNNLGLYAAPTYGVLGNGDYDSSIYGWAGHETADDTSEFCCSGNLTDYYGYNTLVTNQGFHESIMKYGLGKCIVELYDSDGLLLGRTRILAYDTYVSEGLKTYCYILDKAFDFDGRIDVYRTNTTPSYNFYAAPKIVLCDIGDIEQNNNVDGLALCKNSYYLLKNSCFNDYNYSAYVYPNIADGLKIGDTIELWNRDTAEFNSTPSYYFRYKTPPTVSVVDKSDTPVQNDELCDVDGVFGISYTDESGQSSLNYFYLYLSIWNDEKKKWETIERSTMLTSVDDTYVFRGMVDKEKYQVNATCVDKDGDEWGGTISFTINNPASDTYDIKPIFNSRNTTIDIDFSNILFSHSTHKNVGLSFYKMLKNDIVKSRLLEHAGTITAKRSGRILISHWSDYNIKNDSYYDYYIRIHTERTDEWILVGSDIHTDFEGSSLLGLEKDENGLLTIKHNFNLHLHLNQELNDITHERTMNYLNSFSRYPREQKGHQSYFSSSVTGLLGSACNGLYEEPRGIRMAWNEFVDDDTIKLYRGIDGETMIIGIDTNKIKPYNYPEVGIVNEVSISFKEIAPASQYAIFSTELVGE